MSDTSSVSSLSESRLARINESLRRSKGLESAGESGSCVTWLVPLLVIIGVGLLVYLLFSTSCNSNSNSNGSNSDNSNGILVMSNMTNNDGKVVDLDGDKMDMLSQNQPIVVAFLAQGCHWCSKLKPQFVEAAKNSPKPLYTLHAHAKNGMERCKQYGVKGFPTILYIHKGRIVAEYSGDRSPSDIIRWVKSLQ
jgi:thiol-disulfide isomerase/thioredoxin